MNIIRGQITNNREKDEEEFNQQHKEFKERNLSIKFQRVSR
jgi:hypothetical protein